MSRSAGSIVAIAGAFFATQSCGDAFTGRISTPPGATVQPSSEAQGGGAAGGAVAISSGGGAAAPGGGPGHDSSDAGALLPDWDFDDGGELWDGGAPVVLVDWYWNQGLSRFRGNNGQRYQAHCIAMGDDFAVWGANPYTDETPLCSAGAHLGLIERVEGGWLTAEIRPAQVSFEGVTRNGVTGFAWGPFPGSYRFVLPQPSHP